jgi:signal transduction histidine kinase
VDVQALAALLSAIVDAAVGTSALLADRRERAHLLFAWLAFNLGAYNLAQFLFFASDATGFQLLSLTLAAPLPLTALRFLSHYLEERKPRAVVWERLVGSGAVLMLLGLFYGALVYPIHQRRAFLIPFGLYVHLALLLALFSVYRRTREATSRVEAKRLVYLSVGAAVPVLLSAAAQVLAAAGGVPRLAALTDAAAAVLTTLYLYFLSQTLFRYRLIDLQELVGKMVVLSGLALVLATIYGALLLWVGQDRTAFLFNTLVASFVILVLFEPLKGWVEERVNRFMFQERYELRAHLERLRRALINVIDPDELVKKLLAQLETSRRVTDAAIYLADVDGSGYALAGSIARSRPPAAKGAKAPAGPLERLDAATQWPFLERLCEAGVLVIETLEREARALTKSGEDKEAAALRDLVRTMNDLQAGLAIPILSTRAEGAARAPSAGPAPRARAGELLGLLTIRDERLREAYSWDEIELFRQAAAQAAITLENSRIYEGMKERDRLAALGEMAAGLAHEIRNPLGAIKGAAQYLLPAPGTAADGTASNPPMVSGLTSADASVPTGSREFLDIIVEEVNRLNRVVSQFLDYARPRRQAAQAVDVAEVLRRTHTLLSSTAPGTPPPSAQLSPFALPSTQGGKIEVRFEVPSDLPRVRGDAEPLQQVFLNLGLNALEAMPAGGQLTVAVAQRRVLDSVEIRFRDTGPGIPPEMLKNIFIPFFTTKEKGTGLGLAICQRIVSSLGGTLEVRSVPGQGTTFTVVLGVAVPPPVEPAPG